MKIIKLCGFIVLGIIIIIATREIYRKNTHVSSETVSIESSLSPEKKILWHKMEGQVNSWVDGQGKPIDSGVKKIVIVLNLLGFITEQSCEGHLDWGRPYPWIRFATESDEVTALRNETIDIYKRIKEKESEIEKKYPNLSLREARMQENSEELIKMYQKTNELGDAIDKKKLGTVAPLHDLIIDFYKTHPANPDTLLMLSENLIELFSVGGPWQIIRTDNDKSQRLRAYQQEMWAFTEFLVDYYSRK